MRTGYNSTMARRTRLIRLRYVWLSAATTCVRNFRLGRIDSSTGSVCSQKLFLFRGKFFPFPTKHLGMFSAKRVLVLGTDYNVVQEWDPQNLTRKTKQHTLRVRTKTVSSRQARP